MIPRRAACGVVRSCVSARAISKRDAKALSEPRVEQLASAHFCNDSTKVNGVEIRSIRNLHAAALSAARRTFARALHSRLILLRSRLRVVRQLTHSPLIWREQPGLWQWGQVMLSLLFCLSLLYCQEHF